MRPAGCCTARPDHRGRASTPRPAARSPAGLPEHASPTPPRAFLPAAHASILGLRVDRSSTLPLFSASSASSRARFSASCAQRGAAQHGAAVGASSRCRGRRAERAPRRPRVTHGMQAGRACGAGTAWAPQPARPWLAASPSRPTWRCMRSCFSCSRFWRSARRTSGSSPPASCACGGCGAVRRSAWQHAGPAAASPPLQRTCPPMCKAARCGRQPPAPKHPATPASQTRVLYNRPAARAPAPPRTAPRTQRCPPRAGPRPGRSSSPGRPPGGGPRPRPRWPRLRCPRAPQQQSRTRGVPRAARRAR